MQNSRIAALTTTALVITGISVAGPTFATSPLDTQPIKAELIDGEVGSDSHGFLVAEPRKFDHLTAGLGVAIELPKSCDIDSATRVSCSGIEGSFEPSAFTTTSDGETLTHSVVVNGDTLRVTVDEIAGGDGDIDSFTLLVAVFENTELRDDSSADAPSTLELVVESIEEAVTEDESFAGNRVETVGQSVMDKSNYSAPDSTPSVITAAARPKKVTVPSNYVYNPKHKYKTLHDYCTASPDAWGRADFKGPCARHDMCIEKDLKKSKSVRKERRKVCDTKFKKNLNTNCSHGYYQDIENGAYCRAVASTYYAAVRVKTWIS